MPLRSGASKRVVATNIKELMESFKSKGTIGTSTPRSAKAAQKQAIAIALSKKRKTLADGS